MASEKSDFFISYNSVDAKKADWIAWILRKEGYTVRFAKWEVKPGTDISQWMAEALEDCRAMIGVCSPDYLKPEAKYSAIERAAILWQDIDGKAAKFIPVKVRKCDLPVIIGARAYVDVSNSSRDDARDLLLAAPIEAQIPDVEPDWEPEPAETKVPAEEPDFDAPALTLIDTGALPDLSLTKLRGRDTELAMLDKAWKNPKVHIQSLIAWGGQGKTALATHWVDNLVADGGRGADGVLAWSFYSQGSKERATSSDQFLDWALDKLKVQNRPNSANAKAEAIAKALDYRRVVLVLDGVEPMQHGPETVQQGMIKDPALRTLLRRVAQQPTRPNGGLVIVTSRLELKDLQRWKELGAPSHDLDHLSQQAGAELLDDRGVTGTQRELRQTTKDFGGHALALTLLASYLRELHGGDARKRGNIRDLFADEEIPEHGHAYRVIEAYNSEWLTVDEADEGRETGRRRLMRAVLLAIGLFDRPASEDCISALCKEPIIEDFNEVLVAADDAAFAHAINRLREVRLLLPDETEDGSLDAHPLVRQWFGDKFCDTNEAGWQAAHGRLYEHLRNSTEEGDDPTLDDLAPLFQAIPHGCQAGRYQQVLDDVYADRICRRDRSGMLEFHASQKLGAIGPCLSALSWFFVPNTNWGEPQPGLKAADQTWVMAQAALYLGGLGRITESIAPQRAGLQMTIDSKDWRNAAISASNLAEPQRALGDLTGALASAEQSVDLADRSGDAFLIMGFRAARANVLAGLGQAGKAAVLFAKAETLPAERHPAMPRLYSLQGFEYCDLLLGQGEFQAVLERAAESLVVTRRNNWVFDIGLDTSTIGRATLALALTGCNPAQNTIEAAHRLSEAVSILDQAGQANYIPVGLLARARLHRACGDFTACADDLDEVVEIAEPSPMRLYLTDMHLEQCRLAMARRDGFAPLAEHADPPVKVSPAKSKKEIEKLTEEAQTHLDAAAKLVEETGYHRRDTEIEELTDVLAGKRTFADLPIHV